MIRLNGFLEWASGSFTFNSLLRRDKVGWSGASRLRSIKLSSERRQPSVWPSGNRNTALRVSAASMARFEYLRGAPLRRANLGFQALSASGVIQRVMSPRWTRALSSLAQLLTLYFVLYFVWTLEFMWQLSTRGGGYVRIQL
jgi:hypothetical protein